MSFEFSGVFLIFVLGFRLIALNPIGANPLSYKGSGSFPQLMAAKITFSGNYRGMYDYTILKKASLVLPVSSMVVQHCIRPKSERKSYYVN